MEEQISAYGLRDGLSFCRVDGRAVFLDIQEDRYFRLSDRLERAFTAWLDGDDSADGNLGDLVEHKVLAVASPAVAKRAAQAIASPLHSAVEQLAKPRPIGPLIVLDVFTAVCSTQRWLKTRRLQTVIEDVVAYRNEKASQPLLPSTNQALLDAANTFRTARRYVPVESSCLLDSLSLVRFLARRHLSAQIVFGVTDDPFAAHCWVQAGTWILNDTLGNATTHTPIRVV